MCSRTLACARDYGPKGREGKARCRKAERASAIARGTRGREKGRTGETAVKRRKEEAGIRFTNRRYISTINIFVTYRFSARKHLHTSFVNHL